MVILKSEFIVYLSIIPLYNVTCTQPRVDQDKSVELPYTQACMYSVPVEWRRQQKSAFTSTHALFTSPLYSSVWLCGHQSCTRIHCGVHLASCVRWCHSTGTLFYGVQHSCLDLLLTQHRATEITFMLSQPSKRLASKTRCWSNSS